MKVELRDRSGVIGVVELTDGVAVADTEAAKILDAMAIVKPGEPRVRLRPSDGEEYLTALEHNVRGTYLWATSPID